MNESHYRYTSAEQVLEPLPGGGMKLHEIARGGWFELVDPRILSEEMLLSVDSKGDNVMHSLGLWLDRDFHRLPPALITPQLLMTRGSPFNRTLLHRLALSEGFRYEGLNQVVPMLTPAMLMAVDNEGKTVLHYLAPHWGVGLVVPMLTPAMLMAADNEGNTVLHDLAYCGRLAPVISMLTHDMLLSLDGRGDTVIHRAVAWKQSIKVLVGSLDSQMLMFKGSNGRSVLSCAVRDGCLDQIQPAVFRQQWMNKKFRGRPLAQILTEDHADYVGSHMGEFHEGVRAALLAHLLAS